MGGSSERVVSLSPEAVEGEIKLWEAIKICGYADKSSIFSENINVNNVFHQLYKAKEDKKVVKITTKPLYIYYKSEAEKREEERKRLEEERKRLEEEKKKKK